MKHLVKALSVGASRYALQPDTSWKKDITEPSKTGLRHWLLDGTGYSNVILNASNEIVIECIDDSWAKANASDLIANREAANESLLPRQHRSYSPQSLAWPIVTSYYSAYFAAQSFLRCLGLGSIYLEEQEANFLNDVWKARGISVVSNTANYSFTIDTSTPAKIVLRKFGSSGGTHKQFWAGFRQFQNEIHQVLLVSPSLSTLSSVERQTADKEYVKLIQTFFVNTSISPPTQNFAWLSHLRNDINYRFSGNVWLMNWRHSAGLITGLDGLIQRYSNSVKPLPEGQRNFSKDHLAFVATRFCQLVRDATLKLSVP